MEKKHIKIWSFRRFLFTISVLFVIAFIFCLKITLFQVHSGLPPEEHNGITIRTDDVVKVGEYLYFGDGSSSNELARGAIKGGMSKRLDVKGVNRLERIGNLLYIQHEDSKFAIYDTTTGKVTLDVNLATLLVEEIPYEYTMCGGDAEGAYFEVCCSSGEGSQKICFISQQGTLKVLRTFSGEKRIELLKACKGTAIYNLKEKSGEFGDYEFIGVYAWNRKTGEEILLSHNWISPIIHNDGNVNMIWQGQYLAIVELDEVQIMPLDGGEEERRKIPWANCYCFDNGMIYGTDSSRVLRYDLETGKAEYAESEGSDFGGGVNVFDGKLIISGNTTLLVGTKNIYVTPVEKLDWKPYDL